jgi:hypothetical protein
MGAGNCEWLGFSNETGSAGVDNEAPKDVKSNNKSAQKERWCGIRGR